MRVALITNIVSPHQMPFACNMVKRLGLARFRYIAFDLIDPERRSLGWNGCADNTWVLLPGVRDVDNYTAKNWVDEANIVICSLRNFDLFEQRRDEKKISFYMSERWFKPPYGMLRLLHPSYLRMALRFYRLLRSPTFYCLPMGVHAAQDMLRMVRIFARFPQWLFREPLITAKELRSKLLLWGYFVEPSESGGARTGPLKTEGGNDVGHNRSSVCPASSKSSMPRRPSNMFWSTRGRIMTTN